MQSRTLQSPEPRIIEQYEKARQAFERGESVYVISVMRQLVETYPRQLDFRRLLRLAQEKQVGPRKSGFRRFLGDLSMKTLASLVKKNPERALTVAEDLLCEDPRLAAAHRLLGESALELGMPDLAIFAFSDWCRHEPYQLQSHLSLAIVMVQEKRARMAIEVCEKALRLFPSSSELKDLLKKASVQAALEGEGGGTSERSVGDRSASSAQGVPNGGNVAFGQGLNLTPSPRHLPNS